MKKIILAIETSCDETGIAIVEGNGGTKNPSFRILKEIVASQIKIHRPFGGVVPNLAKREHIKNLPLLYKKLFGNREKSIWKSIDEIAVTMGPGLEPALWAGINFAEELAKKWQKPLKGANHMEGHLYSALMQPKQPKFPAIALIVSGGHTILLRMNSMTSWKKLGETRDDAVGEAFDKVARLLGLPYPGGPEISKLAKKGKTDIDFPQPMLNSKDFDFSFSGLKTAVLYYLKDNPKAKTADIAASFQEAAVGVLVTKTFRAVEESGAKSIWLSGGVAANEFLRKELGKYSKKYCVSFLVAPRKWNTDNAAMIGVAAYMQNFKRKRLSLIAKGDLQI